MLARMDRVAGTRVLQGEERRLEIRSILNAAYRKGEGKGLVEGRIQGFGTGAHAGEQRGFRKGYAKGKLSLWTRAISKGKGKGKVA